MPRHRNSRGVCGHAPIPDWPRRRTASGFTFLDPAADGNRQGNRLFHEGRFDEALEYYRKAQVERPDAPELRFNAGDAYFKKNAFKDALQEFGHALKSRDPSLLARRLLQSGHVHVRRQNLQQAVEAYKRSLSITPDDLDAKVNLEWVLEKMREQEKNQDQDRDHRRTGRTVRSGRRRGRGRKNEDPNDDGSRERPPERPNPDQDGNRDRQNRESPERSAPGSGPAAGTLRGAVAESAGMDSRSPGSLAGKRLNACWMR